MCIIGLIGSFWIRHNIHKELQDGRDAFMAAEAARFDRQAKNESSRDVVPVVIVGIGGGLLVFGTYELIVVGAGVMVRRYARVQRDLREGSKSG
jgi:hypothetical protein